MTNRIDKHIIRFILLLLTQVYILNNVLFLNIINPYIYIYFILLLPFNIPTFLRIILGFIMGFSIDLFTGSMAIHASATTFIAYFRPFILSLFAPFDGYEKNTEPTLQYYNLSWWLKYATTTTGIHHFTLFLMEVFHFKNMYFLFLKTILSTMLTVFLMTLLQLFFYKSKSNT